MEGKQAKVGSFHFYLEILLEIFDISTKLWEKTLVRVFCSHNFVIVGYWKCRRREDDAISDCIYQRRRKVSWCTSKTTSGYEFTEYTLRYKAVDWATFWWSGSAKRCVSFSWSSVVKLLSQSNFLDDMWFKHSTFIVLIWIFGHFSAEIQELKFRVVTQELNPSWIVHINRYLHFLERWFHLKLFVHPMVMLGWKRKAKCIHHLRWVNCE